MTSEHDRPDALAPLYKKSKASKFITPVLSPMASSASESPAVQRDPAAQRPYSTSQGTLWADMQPSGTSLSEQRPPPWCFFVFGKCAWLNCAVQQRCSDVLVKYRVAWCYTCCAFTPDSRDKLKSNPASLKLVQLLWEEIWGGRTGWFCCARSPH